MNSEELEMSLRSEFESYLKNTLAEMKQELSQLQEKVASEIEQHKTQIDEVFKSVQTNFEKEFELDAGFKDSIIEHLRLSRDEGAQITAMAIAKAEEFEKENKESAEPAVGIKELHQAVNEISSKTTKSEILKSLVHHASDFAPRGAFFIVKNEHLIGWRVFGKEKGDAEEKIRDVFLPASAESILSDAVKSLETVADSSKHYSDDADVFEKLEFGKPEKMSAIPLIARGRGVAVLYADHGNEGGALNLEALETLVRVAGLTVEVLASGKGSGKKFSSAKRSEVSFAGEADEQSAITDYSAFSKLDESTIAENVEESQESFSPAETAYSKSSAFTDYSENTESVIPVEVVEESPESSYSYDSFTQEEKTASPVDEVSEANSYTGFESNTDTFETGYQTPAAEETYSQFETNEWSSNAESSSDFSAKEFAQNFAKETDPVEYAKDFSYQIESNNSTSDYEIESSGSYQEVQTENFAPVNDTFTSEEFVPSEEQTYSKSFEFENGKTETVEVNEPAPVVPKSRLSERNVDLPIEVTEDERRLHNDARRFARLLVSEIKLYNEQKVKEGRDAGDLYDRLKEAIDRSREMYDKRVQPQVAAKFDYFHYELVNTLAEGDDDKLGAGYPGSAA